MTIGPFKGDYRWLSNFWDAPISFNKIAYPTNEHMYQTHKTENLQEMLAILEAPTAGEAKRLGKELTIRSDWDDHKRMVMLNANILKFTQHAELAFKLLDTGDEELVEFNHWHDNYWGVCQCEDCKDIEGSNHLGKILMSVREHIRFIYKPTQ